MDYKKKIKTAQHRIEELKQVVETLRQIEEYVYDVEKEISRIDEGLPSESELEKLVEGQEKEQILHLIDLLKECYALIDEILGPPEDEMTGEPVGTPMDPVARGSRPSELRLEDFLRSYKPGKNKVS